MFDLAERSNDEELSSPSSYGGSPTGGDGSSHSGSGGNPSGALMDVVLTGRSLEGETASLLKLLGQFLEAKSAGFGDEELQHLFMMNNVAYVVRSV